ncbi:RHS repeat-associated core domain-containing protein [Flavobacterium branchiophilum]|uniref:RHS repeat domain-containing protein n=1 Tax=Flavobacterium branchiophilum TaxID=55197 RepID=UPI000682E401
MRGEKKYSILADHLGTPIEGYDDTGNLVWERSLNANGKTIKETGIQNFCPFLYQGQSFDNEIELAYNRFRYYDVEDGRYISQDPIGLLGGLLFYGYVHDSNCWIDVFGLSGAQGDLGIHGTLKNITGGGQSHHLNQNAAFKDVIPPNDGAAIKLEGNAFKDINSAHYKAHENMESFWDQYRKGGVLEGKKPTNLEYTKALKSSLKAAGLSDAQINKALRHAIKNRIKFGLLGGDKVPKIPRKIYQKK